MSDRDSSFLLFCCHPVFFYPPPLSHLVCSHVCFNDSHNIFILWSNRGLSWRTELFQECHNNTRVFFYINAYIIIYKYIFFEVSNFTNQEEGCLHSHNLYKMYLYLTYTVAHKLQQLPPYGLSVSPYIQLCTCPLLCVLCVYVLHSEPVMINNDYQEQI